MWVRDRKKEGDVRGSIPWKLQNPGVPRVPADGKVMDEANMLSLIFFFGWKKRQLFPETAGNCNFSIKVTQIG